MIELQMVSRMIVRGLYLAPALFIGVWLWGGPEYALSGIAGLALTLLNLAFAAAIIGKVAETAPRMLLVAAMVAFTIGLAIITGISFVLKTTGAVFFPVTGFTLIGSHLLLVLWEAIAGHRTESTARLQAET